VCDRSVSNGGGGGGAPAGSQAGKVCHGALVAESRGRATAWTREVTGLGNWGGGLTCGDHTAVRGREGGSNCWHVGCSTVGK
jgi:hypothetical protein